MNNRLNSSQNQFFILQEHKLGLPVWPYKYRILMRENRMEIANSNDIAEIENDWQYLKTHAVPRLEEAIDLHKEIRKINPLPILIEIVSNFFKFLHCKKIG